MPPSSLSIVLRWNPVATFWTGAMMLEHLGETKAAAVDAVRAWRADRDAGWSAKLCNAALRPLLAGPR